MIRGRRIIHLRDDDALKGDPRDMKPIKVKRGQVWQERDRRFTRTVTIENVRPDDGEGYAEVMSSAGRRSRIRLDRFGKDYVLIPEEA